MKIKNLFLAQIVIATFAFQLLTFNVNAQASFLPATTFAACNSPFSILNADFNGDGKADLAVLNYYDGKVSILLGNGAGGFGAATDFTVGGYPHSFTSADFNGDSKIDLAVANYSDNNVSVLFGDGTGGFSAASNFTTGIAPRAIISADFNGDGLADLVVASIYTNILSVSLGDGVGGFGSNTTFAVGNHPISITSADFNSDGNADLAIGYESLNIVAVMLGNGFGCFGAVSNIAIDGNYSSIITSDFNGDGYADLATSNQSSNNVSVLLGNGVGSFSPSTAFMVGNGSGRLICDDFNADGNVDLAVNNHMGNDVSVLLGNGMGSFTAATNFAVGVNPISIASADFNGDGMVDLAVANFNDNNVSILLNNYLAPSAPVCLVTVDSTLTHNVLVWEKSNLDLTAIDSFIVYREITTNNYERIGAVSKDSMSTFDDFEANPAATAFRYKLKNKSSQGVLSQFSEYHNTMYLTHAGADFSWTPYQIENNTAPVAAYKIYRDDNSAGNFQTIGTTTGNQLGFTDVDYASFPNAQYYVEAVMISGSCQPSRSGFMASRSNVKHIGTSGVQQLSVPPAITIFPNPLSNTLNITGISGKTTLRLYNLVGKLVMEEEVENNTTINTSQVADGIYTLISENKVGKTYHKVMISHK